MRKKSGSWNSGAACANPMTRPAATATLTGRRPMRSPSRLGLPRARRSQATYAATIGCPGDASVGRRDHRQRERHDHARRGCAPDARGEEQRAIGDHDCDAAREHLGQQRAQEDLPPAVRVAEDSADEQQRRAGQRRPEEEQLDLGAGAEGRLHRAETGRIDDRVEPGRGDRHERHGEDAHIGRLGDELTEDRWDRRALHRGGAYPTASGRRAGCAAGAGATLPGGVYAPPVIDMRGSDRPPLRPSGPEETELAVAEGSARASAEPRRGRRPFGVVVLVLIHLVVAALSLAAVAGVAEARPGTGTAVLLEALGDINTLTAVIPIVVLIIAIGLWRLDRWAWYLAMTWTGLGLALQILLYIGGHANYIFMAIFVVEAFYLNQREVKDVFRLPSVAVAPVVLEDDRTGPE